MPDKNNTKTEDNKPRQICVIPENIVNIIISRQTCLSINGSMGKIPYIADTINFCRRTYGRAIWCELKDIFLDELFNAIRMIRFKGISEMFYSGPRNPSLIAAFNACEHRSESVNIEIDRIPVKDLTLHSIYKLASKRELRSTNIISKADKEYQCEATIYLRFNFKNDRDEK